MWIGVSDWTPCRHFSKRRLFDTEQPGISSNHGLQPMLIGSVQLPPKALTHPVVNGPLDLLESGAGQPIAIYHQGGFWLFIFLE